MSDDNDEVASPGLDPCGPYSHDTYLKTDKNDM